MHLSLFPSLRAASLVLLLGQSAVFGQTTVTFRDGLSGYTGTQDTYIRSEASGTSYGSELFISVDGDDGSPGLQPNQGLIPKSEVESISG